MQVSMTVNGEQVTEEIEGRMLLVHFLRDQLRLTGTHWGCDTSNCGTCVVWMDGEPVKSCTVLAAMAGGREIRTVEGLEAAIERARLYREAGADVLFIEAPQTEGEIRAIAAAFPQVPLLFNYAEGGKTPAIEHSMLLELGFDIVIFPIRTVLAATKAMRHVLAKIKEDGSPIRVLPDLPRFGDFVSFIGLPEILDLEQRYRVLEREGDQ